MQAINPDAMPVVMSDDTMELRMAELGEMTVMFARVRAGFDGQPAGVAAGLEGGFCPVPHWGYMLEGQLHMRTPDGERTYEAGQAFYWAPGHVPYALADCSYFDFSPTEQLQELMHRVAGAD